MRYGLCESLAAFAAVSLEPFVSVTHRRGRKTSLLLEEALGVSKGRSCCQQFFPQLLSMVHRVVDAGSDLVHIGEAPVGMRTGCQRSLCYELSGALDQITGKATAEWDEKPRLFLLAEFTDPPLTVIGKGQGGSGEFLERAQEPDFAVRHFTERWDSACDDYDVAILAELSVWVGEPCELLGRLGRSEQHDLLPSREARQLRLERLRSHSLSSRMLSGMPWSVLLARLTNRS